MLYQNDDYGKDYLEGFKAGLGDKADRMIVEELSYEVTDPTVDSQIISLKNSGADVFFNITTPKFAAQAIRKAADIGWQPLHLLNNVSNSVGSVLTPAGLDKSTGLITSLYQKDPTDPQWQDTQDYRDWSAWMDKYNPEADKSDQFNVYGYNVAMTLVHVLEQCGDDLTRENVMAQAANIQNLELPMLLPGVVIDTSADDFFPIESMMLAKFDGEVGAVRRGDRRQQDDVSPERSAPARRRRSRTYSAPEPPWRGWAGSRRRRCGRGWAPRSASAAPCGATCRRSPRPCR